tara:strand:- start:12061 stop:12981 length:921 start_codon:yes stop_codon:yes gene_type:complete
MSSCAIIPCYKVNELIFDRLREYKSYFDYLIIIDDACPTNIGQRLKTKFYNDPKIIIIINKKNLGVGGAVMKGFELALKKNIDYLVKIDGDGQMDINDSITLLDSLKKEKSLYSKGSRFLKGSVTNMPFFRRIGNKVINFIFNFLISNYEISDPLNGYIAINSKVLNIINLKDIKQGFLFETNLLYEASKNNIKVKNFPVKITYSKDITSNFNTLIETFNFGNYFLKLSVLKVKSLLNLENLRFSSIFICIILYYLFNFFIMIFLYFFGYILLNADIINNFYYFVMFMIFYILYDFLVHKFKLNEN